MHGVCHGKGVAWEVHTSSHVFLLGSRIGSLRRHIRHRWDRIILQERPTDNQDTCLFSPPLGLCLECIHRDRVEIGDGDGRFVGGKIQRVPSDGGSSAATGFV